MKTTMKPMQWLQVVLMAVLTIGIAVAGTVGIQSNPDVSNEAVATGRTGVGQGGGGAVCGNSVCEPGEDGLRCPECAVLGNGICEVGETWYNACYGLSTCDCPPVCGDGECQGEDEAANCYFDCHCGNGVCDDGETVGNCSTDCGNETGGCGTVYPPQCDENYGTVSSAELTAEEETELYENIQELLDLAAEGYDQYLNDAPAITAATPYCQDAATDYTWSDPSSGEDYTIPYKDCTFPGDGSVVKVYYGEGSFSYQAGSLDGAGLLAIDGDLQINGGAFWYGIIVSAGDITAQGGGGSYNFQGALMAQDTATFGGSFEVTYDSCAIAAATIPPNKIPHGEVVAWRDM